MIKVGHSQPLGLWFEALASLYSHVPLGFESVLYLQAEVFLYKVTCLASSTSAEQKGISKQWENRESGSRVENIVSFWPVYFFGLQCLGILGLHNPPGHLGDLIYSIPNIGGINLACVTFHYENLKLFFFLNNILYKVTRTREP